MTKDTSGLDAARETAQRLEGESREAKLASTSQAVVALDELRKLKTIGMSYVDPADVRPPNILLVQKLSDLTELVDITDNTPKLGQFFDTGKRMIYDSFDCYFVFAKKGTYIDRRKPEEGNKPKYQVVGVMKSDMGMFGMLLRSSASYSLNNLFSVAVNQELPMFVFNCHVEQKELQNNDGKWFIPVVRIGQVETDPKIVSRLIEIAKRFDAQAASVNLEAPSTGVEDAPDQDIDGEFPY